MSTFRSDITGEEFNDGVVARPGDEEFTREIAEKHFGHKNFSYVGTPEWQPPEPPQEEDPAE